MRLKSSEGEVGTSQCTRALYCPSWCCCRGLVLVLVLTGRRKSGSSKRCPGDENGRPVGGWARLTGEHRNDGSTTKKLVILFKVAANHLS